MKSKRAWIIALLTGIVALGSFLFITNNRSGGEDNIAQQPQIQYGNVVVVKQDIEPRTKITPEMVEVQQKPADTIHPLSLSSIEEVQDMLTLLPLYMGEQVLKNKIADPNTEYLSYRLKEGHVAYTVPVSELTGAGGMIRVGDKINVMGSFGKDIAGKDITDFLLYDISVIAIGKNMAINANAETAEQFSSMTLEVTPDEAAQIAWAQNHGNITFILQSVLNKDGTEEIVAVDSKTLFGDNPEYKDLEYLNALTQLGELRGAEQGLMQYSKGDVQQIRKKLGYTKFYYDDLNPTSKPTTNNTTTEKNSETQTNSSTTTK